MIIQTYLSPAAGKRLIAKGLAAREDVQTALKEHTILIIKGSTNAALAEELLKLCGYDEKVRGFYRGIFKPADAEAKYPVDKYDLIIRKGEIIRDKTVFDIADELGPDDIAFKGANAVNPLTHQAAVLIGNPTGGTMVPLTKAVIGRRLKLIHPVGLEKRNRTDFHMMAQLCNESGTAGVRMMVSPGTAYTEADAFRELFGIKAILAGAGGVAGYEGGCFFLLQGEEAALEQCRALLAEITAEPPFAL
ncbi:MAG: hypothetical protein IJL95_04360 [Solobacterium sp.]|nr:hypothetical protein [Solobacterium sp.]